MQRITSALLTVTFLATTITPALADKHSGGAPEKAGAAAAPAPHADRQAAAAQRPAQQRAMPQQRVPQERAAPEQRVFHSRVIQQQPAPQERQRSFNAAAQERQRSFNAAPQERQRSFNAAPQERQRSFNAAPQERQRSFNAAAQERQRSFNAAPQERVFHNEGSRFEEPVRIERQNSENVAPFAQIVRPERSERLFRNDDHDVVSVPAYHPAYFSGRVVGVENDDVVLQTPAGEDVTVFVRGWHGRHRGWRNRFMTIPAYYQNGLYYAYAPAITTSDVVTSYFYPAGYSTTVQSYGYGPAYQYIPDYGQVANYGYVPTYGYVPDYTTANMLTSLLSNVLGNSNSGSLTNSLLTNFLASYLVSSVAGSSYGQGYAPITPYAANNTYPANYAYPAQYSSPLTYTYPMTCVYSDPYGNTAYDPSCAPVNTASYYTAPTPYAQAQVQGVVVATSGSTLMVMGANGMQPIVVNDAAALQNGYAFNGQPGVGRVIDAYGFYSGNTFIATALE